MPEGTTSYAQYVGEGVGDGVPYPSNVGAAVAERCAVTLGEGADDRDDVAEGASDPEPVADCVDDAEGASEAEAPSGPVGDACGDAEAVVECVGDTLEVGESEDDRVDD